VGGVVCGKIVVVLKKSERNTHLRELKREEERERGGGAEVISIRLCKNTEIIKSE
jgi:hypothetical protein